MSFSLSLQMSRSDAFVGSACPPGSGLAAALPLEMPAVVHPVRVGRETHRLQEKRFVIHANQQHLARARYLFPAQTICRSAKMRIDCTCKLQESDIIEGNNCISSICRISNSTAIVVRSILHHNEPPRLCNLGRLITSSKQTNRLKESNHRKCIHLENPQGSPRYDNGLLPHSSPIRSASSPRPPPCWRSGRRIEKWFNCVLAQWTR